MQICHRSVVLLNWTRRRKVANNDEIKARPTEKKFTNTIEPR